MTAIAESLTPIALFAVTVAAYVGGILASQWHFVTRRHRGTRDRGLLREPGRALARRLESVDHRLVGAAIGIPVTLLVWELVRQHQLGPDAPGTALAALALAGVAALGWLAQELLRLWPERARLRRAIDAQMLAAQSLALLMRQDYWVFHDVHVAGERINHLVAGPRGVFCIDTKARRVPRRWSWRGPLPPPPARVAFDGEQLHFPGWTETASLTDAERQAARLRAWLGEVMPEAKSEIPVFAAIALPGWRVAATHWRRLIVFNPATPNMLVQAGSSEQRLDAATARQLVRQLQSHSREQTEARLRRHARPWHRRLATLVPRGRRGTGTGTGGARRRARG